MSTTIQRRSAGQRGFTLAEVLVASAIFTIIVVAALLLYDRSNQVFKQGSESADLQQNTRVAFDKLVSDVRMAGFDYDRDGVPSGATAEAWRANTVYSINNYVVPTSANGHQYLCIQAGTSAALEPTWLTTASSITNDPAVTPAVKWQEAAGINQYQQPDEQIEFAGPTAVTVRANYDYDTNKANGNGREIDLEAKTPQFPVITTRNNEIVTYALSSTNTAKNTGTITFYADVNAAGTAISRTAYPGGNKERKIDITCAAISATCPGVDLTNANPPYTLERITIEDDGNLLFTPVAENIRSIGFKYFQDTTGQTPLTDLNTTPVDVSSGPGGLGQYDPDNPNTIIPDRLVRAKIRSIQLQLVGMSANPDGNYTDTASYWIPTVTGTTGTTATDSIAPTYRKFAVSSLIVPRNLGKRGMREAITVPPGSPAITSVCVGYCGIAKISWQAPAGGGVSSYAILWDTSATGNFTSVYQAGTNSTAFLAGLTPNVPYYFKLEAVNDYGAALSAAVGPYTPKNATTPEDPPVASMYASGGGGSNPAAVTSEVDLQWQRPMATVSPSDQATCDPAPNVTTGILTAEAMGYNIWRATVATGPYSKVQDYAGATNPAVTNNATNQVTWKDKNAANCIDYYYQVQAVKAFCEPNAAFNTSPAVTHSGIVPAAASNTFKGQAASTGSAPAAGTGLALGSGGATCNPATGLCSVNLSWSAVTQDTSTPTAKPLVIDQYELVRVQSIAGVVTSIATTSNKYMVNGGLGLQGDNSGYWGTTTVTASPAISPAPTNPNSGATKLVDNGEADPTRVNPLTLTNTVPEFSDLGTPYTYDYYVRAVQCGTAGALSAKLTWPCAFVGTTGPGTNPLGAPIITNSFQGDGTLANPYFFSPAAAVSATAAPAMNIEIALYIQSGVTWNLLSDTTGTSVTAFTAPISSPAAGSTYRADVTFTNGGCQTRWTVYGTDQSSSCCLVPKSAESPIDPVVGFKAGTTAFVDIFLKNACDEDLGMPQLSNSFTFTWSSTSLSGGTKLNSVVYPLSAGGTKTVPFNSGAGTVNIDTTGAGNAAKAVTALTSNGTGYKIHITFTKNLPVNPITAFTVNYKRASDLANVACPNVP
jgi:prepilin-type N-terminal cleavage/methylation domain-containing protein